MRILRLLAALFAVLTFGASPALADEQLLLLGIGAPHGGGTSISYDTSLGAYFSGDTTVATFSSLASSGTDSKQLTASFWIDCNHLTPSDISSEPANAVTFACTNNAIFQSGEYITGTNTLNGCEAPNATGAIGLCWSFDNSIYGAQFNVNNSSGVNSTDSLDFVGDGTLANTYPKGSWRHYVISLDTDANKVCNGGTGSAPGGSYTGNCWDIRVDGVSKKAQWVAARFNPITPNIFSNIGLQIMDSFGPYLVTEWAADISLDNTSILNATTGLIPDTAEATFNSYPTNGLNRPVRAAGVTDCSDQYGHAPLVCLYGDGPAMGTNHGTLGVSTGHTLSAQAGTESQSSGGVRTPFALTYGLQPTAYGPMGPPAGRPVMRWPVQYEHNNVAGSLGTLTASTYNLPVVAGDVVILQVQEAAQGAVANDNIQCPTTSGWTWHAVSMAQAPSTGGAASAMSVAVCWAIAVDTTSTFTFTWTAPAAGTNDLLWLLADYKNSSGVGQVCGNTLQTATANLLSCGDNTHLTSATGSTLFSSAMTWSGGSIRGAITIPSGSQLRAVDIPLSTTKRAGFWMVDTYGVASGTSVQQTFVEANPSQMFGGSAVSIEIKP